MLFLMSFTHYWVLVKILNIQLKESILLFSVEYVGTTYSQSKCMYVHMYVFIFHYCCLSTVSGLFWPWMARTALQHDAHITHIRVTDFVYNWFSICMLTSKISQSQQPDIYIFASFPFISTTYHIFCCFINCFILDKSN